MSLLPTILIALLGAGAMIWLRDLPLEWSITLLLLAYLVGRVEELHKALNPQFRMWPNLLSLGFGIAVLAVMKSCR